jgi:hypothetical protein
MKTALFLSALVGLSLVTSNLPATTGDDHESDQSSEGCSKEFEAKFCLLPTTNAPADAKGKAKIESESEDGVQTGEMKIKVKGLPDGDYTVSVFLASSSNTVDIGQITLSSSSSGGDDEDDDQDRDSIQKNDDNHDDGDDNDDDQGEDEQGDDHHQGEAAEFEFALPSDLDPMDIVQVIVSDSNGTQLLVGDLSDSDGGCKATLTVDAPVTSGDAAPEAAGTAHLKSKVRKGKVHNRFTLVANNVPPRSTFTVEVNGTEVGTAKSNKKGKLLLKKLPKNISSVDTVRLLDSNGNEVAHTNF